MKKLKENPYKQKCRKKNLQMNLECEQIRNVYNQTENNEVKSNENNITNRMDIPIQLIVEMFVFFMVFALPEWKSHLYVVLWPFIVSLSLYLRFSLNFTRRLLIRCLSVFFFVLQTKWKLYSIYSTQVCCCNC